jgi:hypothetical protein
VHQLVLELIERSTRGFTARLALRVHRVQPRLDVEGLYQRIRVEEQLQDRVEQCADPPDRPPRRLIERPVFEDIVGQLRGCKGWLAPLGDPGTSRA